VNQRVDRADVSHPARRTLHEIHQDTAKPDALKSGMDRDRFQDDGIDARSPCSLQDVRQRKHEADEFPISLCEQDQLRSHDREQRGVLCKEFRLGRRPEQQVALKADQ
jgi:hypothetical protein